jgi:hypothetical protein
MHDGLARSDVVDLSSPPVKNLTNRLHVLRIPVHTKTMFTHVIVHVEWRF